MKKINITILLKFMSEKRKHKTNFVNLTHARTPEQVKVMTQIQKDGVCPFCEKYFTKYHPKKIIKKTKHWFFTENMSPYEGTKFHFLLVCRRHLTLPGGLKIQESIDLFSLIKWATKKFKIIGGSILIRFGDPNMTGGSVNHLHAHIIVGQPKNKKSQSLKVKVGYN